MSKRSGEPNHGRKTIVKKRKSVKIQRTLIPDSDEDDAPSNVDPQYVRLVKTRVATSGQGGSVTKSSIALMKAEGIVDDSPVDVNIEHDNTGGTILQGVVSKTTETRRKRGRVNDSTKMQSWLDVRPVVLDEIVSLDGPGDLRTDLCSSCLKYPVSPLYRCLECSYGSLFCGECAVNSHQTMPLHRLECWRDGFFDRESLHSLGFVCYLGHGGAACPVDSLPHDIVVVDINGWHRLRITFCACGTGVSQPGHYRQLLRMRWYPASFNRPRTAFSFDLLETYHKVTLQGKLNLYDFYLAIMHKSDNEGRSKPMYRYHEISRCTRQWRHLKGVKRGGGAHQVHPLSETPPGSFAIECPACPHPGRNLPSDWDSVRGANEWIYAQFIAVDANFKLKSKNRNIKDPELGSGWSYFVENTAYSHHVASNHNEEDVRMF